MRKVLITGASRGIGKATAKLFAEYGDTVYINYNHSEKEANELAKEIGGIAIRADVSDSKQVNEMFDKISGVDVLVNNAGICGFYMTDAMTDAEWNKIIDTNLNGTFYCTRAALPYMIRKKCGAIVNVSSIWGVTGAACEVAYSAAKSGIIGITKALAKEVGLSGIRVNCVAPGVIETDMNKELSADTLAELCNETPLGRIGKPKEVAEAIYYLSKDDSFITGQVLGVNGGYVI